MAKNSLIDHLAEERGSWDQRRQELGNVLLPIGHESLFVARAAAEGDHHRLAAGQSGHPARWGDPKERSSGHRASDLTQESAAASRNSLRNLTRPA